MSNLYRVNDKMLIKKLLWIAALNGDKSIVLEAFGCGVFKNKTEDDIIRAFIGIDFESELKNDILKLQQKLKKFAIKGRWKHIDNFHLTLKFLDEINASQIKQIDEAMKKMCTGIKPFNITLSGLGTFNGRNNEVRVLWLGLEGDIANLKTLQNSVDDIMAPIGFPPEKRSYTPHVTIGQDIIFEDNAGVVDDFKFDPIRVDNLILFKSEQVQNKRVYTKVSQYNFGL